MIRPQCAMGTSLCIEKQKADSDWICKFNVIGSLLLFAFVNTDDATGLKIIVPHIPALVIYWHVYFTAGIFLLLLFRGFRPRLDLVTALLMLRCITDLITYYLNIETISENYFGYYVSTVTALCSYCICRQAKGESHFYYKYIASFGIILALQTIYTAMRAGVPYLSLYYKGFMNIPYAASNVIASALVPIAMMAFFPYLKKPSRIIIFVICSAGTVLTKSRGGIILLICSSAYCLIFFHSKRQSPKNVALLVAIIVVTMLLSNDDFINLLFKGYAKNDSLNSLTSGRLNIFANDFKAFFEKPIFGHGLGYGRTNISGTHNLIIDLLYKCGVLGLSVYLCALFGLLKTNTSPYFKLFLVIMFINSMFEVCYFSYKCDTLFWMIAGLNNSKLTDTLNGLKD